MKRNRTYVVAIFSTGYKVLACSNSFVEGALTLLAMRRPSMFMVLRDGSTGKRYSAMECVKELTRIGKVSSDGSTVTVMLPGQVHQIHINGRFSLTG